MFYRVFTTPLWQRLWDLDRVSQPVCFLRKKAQNPRARLVRARIPFCRHVGGMSVGGRARGTPVAECRRCPRSLPKCQPNVFCATRLTHPHVVWTVCPVALGLHSGRATTPTPRPWDLPAATAFLGAVHRGACPPRDCVRVLWWPPAQAPTPPPHMSLPQIPIILPPSPPPAPVSSFLHPSLTHHPPPPSSSQILLAGAARGDAGRGYHGASPPPPPSFPSPRLSSPSPRRPSWPSLASPRKGGRMGGPPLPGGWAAVPGEEGGGAPRSSRGASGKMDGGGGGSGGYRGGRSDSAVGGCGGGRGGNDRGSAQGGVGGGVWGGGGREGGGGAGKWGGGGCEGAGGYRGSMRSAPGRPQGSHGPFAHGPCHFVETWRQVRTYHHGGRRQGHHVGSCLWERARIHI